MTSSRSSWLWVLILLTGAFAGPNRTLAGDGGADAVGDLPGLLHTAQYRATVFSYQASGTLLWLAGSGNLVRLEIRRGGAAEATGALLSQSGQGWTAVLGGPGEGTINAWGESWQFAPAGLRKAVQVVTEALEAGPPPAGSARGQQWRSVASGSIPARVRVGSLSRGTSGSGFHGRMSERGLGRGGQDELLELAWAGAPADSTAWLQVRSTRRPGRLELVVGKSQAVMYAMPEAFVPLWPLDQLVKFIRK